MNKYEVQSKNFTQKEVQDFLNELDKSIETLQTEQDRGFFNELQKNPSNSIFDLGFKFREDLDSAPITFTSFIDGYSTRSQYKGEATDYSKRFDALRRLWRKTILKTLVRDLHKKWNQYKS